MSTARDLAVIEAKYTGTLRETSPWTPVLTAPSPAEPPDIPLRNRLWKIFIGLASVLSAAAAIAAYQPWHTLASGSVGAEPATTQAPIVVNIERPAPAGGANIVLPATLRPWQTATLHARVSGYLTAWHRDLGSQVKVGELLAEIETPELDQELAEAEALVREAEAAVAQAQAERVEAQAELRVAQAQLLRAEAEHELAKSQLVRRDKLVKTLIISQEEHDTFRRQVEARAADVTAAKSDVARRQSNLDTRAAVIAAREGVMLPDASDPGAAAEGRGGGGT